MSRSIIGAIMMFHTTDDCRGLKDEVENIIYCKQLQEYVQGANRQPQQQAPLQQGNQLDGQDIEVQVIIGEPVTSNTNQARKNYARQARSEPFPQ